MAGLVQNIDLALPDLPILRYWRNRGLKAFEAQGVPTAKTEAWRYTKPRDLNSDDFILSVTLPIITKSEQTQKIPFACYPIIFENGILYSKISEMPSGLCIMPLIDALFMDIETQEQMGIHLDVENYPFAALNTYYLNQGVYIYVDSNVELERPIVLINHSSVGPENLFFNIHNLIVLKKGAKAEFVEYYNYSGAVKSRYFANIVNEIFIEKDAELNHYKVQNEAFKANHVALNMVSVKEGGNYNGFCLQKGANIGRNETKVLLKEKNAGARVDAAYIMNGWATLDTTTDIEHLAEETCSEQLVKGVIGGDARGVFQGKIHIAPKAVKTSGKQLHKALLLSDGAEIDVKPELEIFADDVKCSHGAASGELDEEQLFYMQSRGIDREEARQLLIDAYLDEVISRLQNDEISEWIRSLIKENQSIIG